MNTPNINTGPQNFKEILQQKKTIKPPAYPWQDFALKIIAELNIPPQKRNSVFRVCKTNSKDYIEKCLNDTKELCQTGQQWKYFFKIVSKK
ncbi:MAG: hypothetical protein WC508_02725 [Patescibacteria group bacterium]